MPISAQIKNSGTTAIHIHLEQGIRDAVLCPMPCMIPRQHGWLAPKIWNENPRHPNVGRYLTYRRFDAAGYDSRFLQRHGEDT